jgi:hypothetical protein
MWLDIQRSTVDAMQYQSHFARVNILQNKMTEVPLCSKCSVLSSTSSTCITGLKVSHLDPEENLVHATGRQAVSLELARPPVEASV